MVIGNSYQDSTPAFLLVAGHMTSPGHCQLLVPSSGFSWPLVTSSSNCWLQLSIWFICIFPNSYCPSKLMYWSINYLQTWYWKSQLLTDFKKKKKHFQPIYFSAFSLPLLFREDSLRVEVGLKRDNMIKRDFMVSDMIEMLYSTSLPKMGQVTRLVLMKVESVLMTTAWLYSNSYGMSGSMAFVNYIMITQKLSLQCLLWF